MIAYGLYIAVMINGEQWEAVPAVYTTYQECEIARIEYTKQEDLLVDSSCYLGTFKEKEEQK